MIACSSSSSSSSSSSADSERAVAGDTQLDYHCSIIYNGKTRQQKELERAQKLRGLSISRPSQTSSSSGQQIYENNQKCYQSIFNAYNENYLSNLNDSQSVISLPNGHYLTKQPSTSRANAPMTTSNLRKLNYLNRAIYLPTSGPVFSNEPPRAPSLRINNAEEFLVLNDKSIEDCDVESFNNTLSDVDTIIETYDICEYDANDIKCRDDSASYDKSDERRENDEKDEMSIELENLKLNLKDLDAIARSRAAKPKNYQGHVLKSF